MFTISSNHIISWRGRTALENGKTQAHMQCLQHKQTYPPAHITNSVESLFPLEAEKGAAEGLQNELIAASLLTAQSRYWSPSCPPQ